MSVEAPPQLVENLADFADLAESVVDAGRFQADGEV